MSLEYVEAAHCGGEAQELGGCLVAIKYIDTTYGIRRGLL